MAGKDFGGRMQVRLASGELLSIRGTFSVKGAGQSNEAMVNQDDSVDRVGTPTAKTAEVTFADKGIDFNTLMTAPRQNISIFEEFTTTTHYFFNAFFAGDPSSNRMNGELSGLTIVGETYRRTEG